MNNPNTTLTRTWTCVLFDLDGTLTDSAPGITSSLTQTFTTLGLPVPDEAGLLAYVGPPLLESFRTFAGMSELEALNALTVYRDAAVSRDLHDNAVFPGIVGLLRSLSEAGIPVAVATSKPESRAIRILEHFGIADYFQVIAGASEDESRSTKTDVVAYALDRLRDLDVDLSRAVLVGDRSHDVEGATANGIPTILVEWGYGSPAEADGAMAIVHSADQLRKLLLG
ncbi:HAD hydrolase-like protein [Rathayibacter soli]|uniref:HAD hydrolase-like protein n=1 Tax=Rathayibacter soli TaxID=3144168 RepID=UPI0027E4AC92|nr:HAD hydrolase-like protein [Glaciibacter superstes]